MKIKRYILQTIKTIALPVLVIAVFALLTDGRSLNGRTLIVTMRQSVIPIIISIALVGNLTLGMIDFSAGAVVIASSIIGANMMKITETGIVGMAVFCIISGIALTSLTGFLNNRLRVPILVLTIGLMLVYEALPRVFFNEGAMISIKYSTLALAPWIFIILGVMCIVFYVLFNLTTYGHNIRALGGGEEIASKAGLNLARIKQTGFTVSGIFLGVASMLYISSNGMVQNVSMFGSMSIIFDAFMGVFLAFFLSRYCNLAIGIVIGTFTITSLNNGFIAMGISVYIRGITSGIFLLVLMAFAANQERFRRWHTNRERARIADNNYMSNSKP